MNSERIQTEITQTVEAIVRTNETLERHRNRANPSNLAIQQYQQVKDNLTQQLLGLLRELEIQFPMAA